MQQILALGIYAVTPTAGYIDSSNSALTINNNNGTQLSGTAIVNAAAGSTYQLRNAGYNNITLYNFNNTSANITITRIA